MTTTRTTFCRLCEVGCGMVATVEDRRRVQVRADKDHPVTQGFACNKGLLAVDVHLDPDRVLRPQRRTDGRLDDVSWDDALADIAARLRTIIAEHGPEASAIFLGNPNAVQRDVGPPRAVPALSSAPTGSSRRPRRTAATSTRSASWCTARPAQPIPDLDRTELLMLIGTNPRVSKSSFMTVPDPVAALAGIVTAGRAVIFVDPARLEPDIGESRADAPRQRPVPARRDAARDPRTVGFRLGAFDGRVDGLDEVCAFVAPYSPEAVADVVGIPAEQIRQLAHDFAAADGASIHASTGLNMGRQGALAYWLVQMLSLCTGNLDRPGGNFFGARASSRPCRAASTAPRRRSSDRRWARPPLARHDAARARCSRDDRGPRRAASVPSSCSRATPRSRSAAAIALTDALGRPRPARVRRPLPQRDRRARPLRAARHRPVRARGPQHVRAGRAAHAVRAVDAQVVRAQGRGPRGVAHLRRSRRRRWARTPRSTPTGIGAADDVRRRASRRWSEHRGLRDRRRCRHPRRPGPGGLLDRRPRTDLECVPGMPRRHDRARARASRVRGGRHRARHPLKLHHAPHARIHQHLDAEPPQRRGGGAGEPAVDEPRRRRRGSAWSPARWPHPQPAGRTGRARAPTPGCVPASLR